MNTSNKTLLQILVEELPKRGGWPEGAVAAVQDGPSLNGGIPKKIKFAGHGYKIGFCNGNWIGGDHWNYGHQNDFGVNTSAVDHATTIVPSEQYEAALAGKEHPLPWDEKNTDADGWIEWNGGECPVEKGTLVDVRYRNSEKFPDKFGTIALEAGGYGATDRHWNRDGYPNDIIAYRLHQPQTVEEHTHVGDVAGPMTTAPEESDLNDCIGQPQSNDDARDEILYELANFAATTKTSLDIGVATEIAIWLSGKGYRKQ